MGHPDSIVSYLYLSHNATTSQHPHPWYYKPKFVCAKVTRENVNDLLKVLATVAKLDCYPLTLMAMTIGYGMQSRSLIRR